MNLDIAAPKPKKSGRRTLTKPEWDAVIKHLLTRDTEPLLTPTKHKNIRQSTKNIHARIVRLTLLQAVSGLRIAEANQLQWKHIIDGDYGMLINASADIVKGRKGKERGRYIGPSGFGVHHRTWASGVDPKINEPFVRVKV